MSDVFLNYKYLGKVDDGEEFVENIRDIRRKNELFSDVNVSYDVRADEVYIETCKGRVRRPLIVVKDGKSMLSEEHIKRLKKNKLSWSDLVEQGVIEYLDAAEEENAYIALCEDELSKEHTHLEISPIIMFGLCSSLVPYANYGQSSRLNRGQKTQKQSLGLYACNYPLRIDTDVSLLHYPQIPITGSFTKDVLKKHPAGQNITIALMSYEGYNIQDAVILNKGSIERGLARSTYFRPYSVEELRYSGGLTDEICVPDKSVKGYRSEKDYRFLEEDGVVSVETRLKADDVVIGRTSPPRFLGDLEEFSLAANIRRETSVRIKQGEEGIVDMVVLTENEEGNRLIRVRLRDQRLPEIGDKFASRHGQKGVVGLIVDEADMPFSASGIIPDLIFSPHSIPSRMTVSHLIEILAGKVGALKGESIDGTTFDSMSKEELKDELLKLGFRENGTEMFYNGMTGKEFKALIFVGNMYYLKLKHMVANKIHARASGRVQLLTRQPIEGRAKGGGLRLGEMEKDCLVAHGASLLLKERFDSDKTVVYVCENCGMLAVYDEYRNKKYCMKCGSNVEITPVELSYAFKLLLDELKGMCFYPKLVLRSKY